MRNNNLEKFLRDKLTQLVLYLESQPLFYDQYASEISEYRFKLLWASDNDLGDIGKEIYTFYQEHKQQYEKDDIQYFLQMDLLLNFVKIPEGITPEQKNMIWIILKEIVNVSILLSK
jgi:hypothetical protein